MSNISSSSHRSTPSSGRRKHRNKTLYYVILAVLFAVIIFSGIKIISYFNQKNKSEKSQNKIIDEYTSSTATNTDEEIENDEHAEGSENAGKNITEPEPDTISVDFTNLTSNYPNVVGYIYCANTGINYPIMQTTDNDYYLNHDIDGTSNDNGCIFMACENSASFSDKTTLIYGHHMKSGRMFAALLNYRNSSYYSAHPYLYIYTPSQNYRLDLFAGFICDGSNSPDVYQLSYSSSEIESFIERSTFKSNIGSPTGNIVTLSTCSYTGQYTDERYVVMGELVPID